MASLDDQDLLTWRKVLEEEHCLLAIRHGETTYNVEDRCATTTDVPMTKAGRIAALNAAASLREVTVDRVFTSPMSRARDTAQLVMPEYADRLEDDDRLREPPAGPFEGQVFRDLWDGKHPLSAQFNDYMDHDDPIVPEGAEPVGVTASKVNSFLEELGQVPGRYVVFSHGGVLRIIASIFAGNDPKHAHRLKVNNCHAVALKWFPEPPHQVLAINLPPDRALGRFKDSSEARSGSEISTVGPKAAAAYAAQAARLRGRKD